jgi:uncharacterized protein (DUF433 family)
MVLSVAQQDVTVAPPGALLVDVLRVFLGESRESLVFDRITVEVGTMNGRPCIRGLRFTVAHLLRLVAVGWTLEQIQGESPFIEAEDIQQALLYAAHSAEVTALSSHGIG